MHSMDKKIVGLFDLAVQRVAGSEYNVAVKPLGLANEDRSGHQA